MSVSFLGRSRAPLTCPVAGMPPTAYRSSHERGGDTRASARGLYVGIAQPLPVGALIQHLQGRDLVPVLLDVLLERLHDRHCLVAREPGLYDTIGAHRVDGLLVGSMDVHQPLPQVGIRREGPGGVLQQLATSLGDRRFGRFVLPCRVPGGFQGGARVGGFHQVGDEFLERHP